MTDHFPSRTTPGTSCRLSRARRKPTGQESWCRWATLRTNSRTVVYPPRVACGQTWLNEVTPATRRR